VSSGNARPGGERVGQNLPVLPAGAIRSPHPRLQTQQNENLLGFEVAIMPLHEQGILCLMIVWEIRVRAGKGERTQIYYRQCVLHLLHGSSQKIFSFKQQSCKR